LRIDATGCHRGRPRCNTSCVARNLAWNLASAWEAIADEIGDEPALSHGDLTRSWADLDDRAARFASVLGTHGIGHDAKVAFYLYNGPEYIEATFGCFKQRAVPVNVNYRYTEAELKYLLDNSDAEAVVFSAEFADTLEAVLPDLPDLRLHVCVSGAGVGRVGGLTGALDYEQAVAQAAPAPRIDRSLDDLWFLYTGGTTGMPKGVMWPHRSLMGAAAPTFRGAKEPTPESPAEFAATATRIRSAGRAVRLLPAAPLMHGTSAIASWGVLQSGGSLVTLAERSLDADALLEAVQGHRVTNLTIVGDAFAKPIVKALESAEANGAPYDLSSLKMIVSSGVIWSQPVKDEILARADILLADLLGSSEGVGFANSVARRGAGGVGSRPGTARFKLGPDAAVFTEEGVAVEPGSGESGLLAVGGPIPIGYYKDNEKTAATFREFAGRLWSVPGDWATIDSDGNISLLGRGSGCINTAGEKVYPEEVEETLKLHVAVIDANVVGLPDDKWGQAVTAVVELAGPDVVDQDDLIAHCRQTLAGYKCPKRVVVVDQILRGPNGKADYRWANRVASA
jgi:acyl-CoA synthetase (AMP-forming)/AMP-acid ligase II